LLVILFKKPQASRRIGDGSMPLFLNCFRQTYHLKRAKLAVLFNQNLLFIVYLVAQYWLSSIKTSVLIKTSNLNCDNKQP
jgi:hypothetical protein